MLSSNNWINPRVGWGYSIGLVIYLALIIMFAYFYTSITFNPIEIAGNMKKQGEITGITPAVLTLIGILLDCPPTIRRPCIF